MNTADKTAPASGRFKYRRVLGIATLLAVVMTVPLIARAEPEQVATSGAVDLVMAKPTPQVQQQIEAMINKFGVMMGDLKGARPSQLFDKTVSPMYLAEEIPDWTEGVEQLSWYHEVPARLAFVEAIDYKSSNIRVRMLGPDVALAAWHVHCDQKMRGRRPWAENFRANAILRNTSDGWKFVYYAEAPRSTMAYVSEMYERFVSPEFAAKYPGPKDKVGF